MRRRSALIPLLLLLAAPVAAQVAPEPAIPVTLGEPAELLLWNRPIVTFRASIGEATPAKRVERAQERFDALPDEELGEPPRALPAHVDRLDGLMIFIGTRQVFNILNEDLDPEGGETIEQVGTTTVQRLREVLAARVEQRSLPLLLRAVARSVAATLAFALVAWALTRFRRWLQQRIAVEAERHGGATVRQLRRNIAELGSRAAQIAALGLGAAAAYLWLTYELKQFPYTAPWGDALGHRLEAVLADVATGIVDSLPDLLTVLVIFLLTRVVVRMLQGLFAGVEQGRLSIPGIQPETADATRRISTVLLWLFAITIAYPYIPGSETEAFRGVSVFLGLMLSLGSAGLVNQVMSGLVVVYARAIRPGEYVRVGDAEGVVTEVGLLSTKIATAHKEEITVPNGVMISQATTNFSRLADRQGAIVTTSVSIGYDAPWRQVHALLRLAASRTPAVRSTPPPRVLQRSLSDFYVEYQLLASVDDPTRRPHILSDLHANIQDAFNEFGVQIMSPHFVAQPGQPVRVPKEQWHAPPAEPDEE